MDAKTCLKKLADIGVLAFATIDERGRPRVKSTCAVCCESGTLYFFAETNSTFCRELLTDGRVQALGCTVYQEMIHLSGKAEAGKFRSCSSKEKTAVLFFIREAQIEYVNLGVRPVFRRTYILSGGHWLRPVQSRQPHCSVICLSCGSCTEAGAACSVIQK